MLTWADLEADEVTFVPRLALLTLLAYCAAVAAVATWSFQRRDVSGT